MTSTLAALRHRLRSRLGIALALTATVTLVAAGYAGARILAPAIENTRAVCAEFTDAVGLYPGNKVAILGIDVGTVTAVTNKSDHVEVDFTVPADLDLAADVGAVTYAQSIVTDRHVELTKPYDSGPKFTGPQCIPLDATRTPLGVSRSFNALGKLTDAILGPDPGANPADSPGAHAINDSLKAAARSLDGTGAPMNQTLQRLVPMIGDPLQADADYRQLTQSAYTLTNGWLKHWDTFAVAITTLPDSARLIDGLSDEFATALARLVHLLPVLVATVNRFAPRIYHNISDKAIPWIRDLLNAWSPNIVGSITALPPLTNWLANIYEPAWGTHNITYLPPRVAISPSQASAICNQLRARNTPGTAAACAPGTTSDPVTLGLTDLIMGGALG